MSEEGTDVRLRLLARVVELIDPVGPEHVNIQHARSLIAEAGIAPGLHVGREGDWTERLVLDWYLGQYADIIDNEHWAAMNGLLNLSHGHLDRAPA